MKAASLYRSLYQSLHSAGSYRRHRITLAANCPIKSGRTLSTNSQHTNAETRPSKTEDGHTASSATPSSTAAMPLVFRPMRESDAPAFDRINLDAFTLGGIMPFMYPNGYTAADRAHSIAGHVKKMRAGSVHKYMAVVDTDAQPPPEDLEPLPGNDADATATAEEAEEKQKTADGRVVGVSMWHFYPRDRTPQELEEEDKAGEAEGFAPTADRERVTAFFAALSAGRKEILGGRAHVLLHILATDPAYHRRGVGAQSLEWGLAEADKLGLPVYLEASAMGRPLYERFGFEAVKPLDFSMKALGNDREMEHTIMLRPAKTAKTAKTA